jgi:hypothetical protein
MLLARALTPGGENTRVFVILLGNVSLSLSVKNMFVISIIYDKFEKYE